MPMINSPIQLERARRQIVRWKAMKRRIDSMIENFGVEDPEILVSVVDNHIEVLERAISEYEQSTSLERSDCMKSAQSLPQYLVRARLKLGWTQTELGRRVGVSSQVIHKYERSNYLQVDLQKVLSVAKVLDSELDNLQVSSEVRRLTQ